MDYKTVIKDIRTYHIMMSNQNYYDRLLEAYNDIKNAGIKNLAEFTSKYNRVPVGAFTYYEITIFDRIKDEEYKRAIESAWFAIQNHSREYVEDPVIGDRLASWGRLGNTPFREELISKGYILEGLTEEEANKHFGGMK
jgi:hypothetical protein